MEVVDLAEPKHGKDSASLLFSSTAAMSEGFSWRCARANRGTRAKLFPNRNLALAALPSGV